MSDNLEIKILNNDNQMQTNKTEKESKSANRYLICLMVPNLLILITVVVLLIIIMFTKEFEITFTKIKLNETENIETHQTLVVENYFRITTREEWCAAPTNGNLSIFNNPPTNVIIGQTNTQNCNDFESCKLQLLLMQQFFIQLRNFEDIGYNFLIGGDGAVYEGIGWDYIGYHTKGHNENSIGIGFIGNYQFSEPTENQLSATKLLIENGIDNNKLKENYRLMGQRDLMPALRSPGDVLYARIKKWKHYAKMNDKKYYSISKEVSSKLMEETFSKMGLPKPEGKNSKSLQSAAVVI